MDILLDELEVGDVSELFGTFDPSEDFFGLSDVVGF